MKGPELCEHANEVPSVCPCPPDCYCMAHTCRTWPSGAGPRYSHPGHPRSALTSPIQFAVGRPRDPDPPEHLELTLISLTAAEELIGLLQVAARKLMLGQSKAVTIVQGRLVTNDSR